MAAYVKEDGSPSAYVNLDLVWRVRVRLDGSNWVLDVIATSGNVETLGAVYATQAEAEEALRVLVHGFDL